MTNQYDPNGSFPNQYSGPADQPTAKKKRKWPWIVGAIVALFVVIGIASPKGEEAETVAKASEPTTSLAAPAPSTGFPAPPITSEPAPKPQAAVPTVPPYVPPTTQAAAPTTTPAKKSGKNPLSSNGTYLIGTGPNQIAPGEYAVEPRGMFGFGYWARCADKGCSMTGTGGVLGAVIENGTVDGPGFLTIAPTDVAIELQDVTLTPQ